MQRLDLLLDPRSTWSYQLRDIVVIVTAIAYRRHNAGSAGVERTDGRTPRTNKQMWRHSGVCLCRGLYDMSIVADEESFIERLSTYRVDTWFAKPSAVAPEICASFGWSNVGLDRLECHTCKATLQYTSSKDVLELESEETVTQFLQNLEWEHDAECIWCEHQCPAEFRSLRFDDPQRLYSDVATRFTRLSTVWDLPKLNFLMPELDTEMASKLRRLQERLQTEVETSAPSATSDAWQRRGHVLTILALLGWEMKVLDYPLGHNVTSMPESLVQGKTMLRPEARGYCLSRQCVLHCLRCTASFGLWGFQSAAEVPIEEFREAAKTNIDRGLHVVVDAETGEVQDLFQHFYESDVTESAADTPVPSSGNEAEKNMKRSFSLELDDSSSQPVFGLQCLKKKRVFSVPSTDDRSLSFLNDPVRSGPILNPLEEHRIFCVYRSQWQRTLEAIL